MVTNMLRVFFSTLSNSVMMRRFAVRFGLGRRIARRFIAGETLDDAVEAVRKLNEAGMEATLNHLGEKVNSREDARRAAVEYGAILERIHGEGLRSTVSIKPTHLGLDFGEEFFRENMAKVLQRAGELCIGVEMDIEDSPTTDATLGVYRSLLEEHGSLRIALQAYLFRTADDLESVIGKGGSVRLVKGAYNEPRDVAWKRKDDVDAEYARLIVRMLEPAALEKGFYPALGTHDHRLIERAMDVAAERGVGRDRFEFQMLLGVRRDWQQRLVTEGFRMRIYVPFGTQWYPYFMRRRTERPANVLFMLRAMLGK